MVNHQPISETGEPLTSGGECDLVAIQSENPQVFVAFEQQLGMAAASERGVEHDTFGDLGEQLRDLVGHHRKVKERFAHRTPS